MYANRLAAAALGLAVGLGAIAHVGASRAGGRTKLQAALDEA